MAVYLSSSDVADAASRLGLPEPAELESWAVAASALVTQALRTAWYRADRDGGPLHPPYRQACREAARAQVSAWLTYGADPLTGLVSPAEGAAGGAVSSSGVGSGSVTYAGAEAEAEAVRSAGLASLSALTPGAAAHLAGIPRGVVVV